MRSLSFPGGDLQIQEGVDAGPSQTSEAFTGINLPQSAGADGVA